MIAKIKKTTKNNKKEEDNSLKQVLFILKKMNYRFLTLKQIDKMFAKVKINKSFIHMCLKEQDFFIIPDQQFEFLNDEQLEEIVLSVQNHHFIHFNKLSFIVENDKKDVIETFFSNLILNYSNSTSNDEEQSNEEITTESSTSEEGHEDEILATENEFKTSMQEYFNLVSKFKLLTKEEEIRLFKSYKEDNNKEALHLIANSNSRLVISVAKKYQNRGLPFIDLIHDGNLGLMRSIEKFDYTKGFKFSTYCHWWIEQSISRNTADKGQMIRIPVHLFETKNKINKFVYNYMNENKNEPTIEEISKALNINTKKVSYILEIGKYTIFYDNRNQNTFTNDTLFESIENQYNSWKNVIKKNIELKINEIINSLSEREQYVIKNRFQITTDEKKIVFKLNKNLTLNEVGNRLKITRERVRQIQIDAINKIQTEVKKTIIIDMLVQ